MKIAGGFLLCRTATEHDVQYDTALPIDKIQRVTNLSSHICIATSSRSRSYDNVWGTLEEFGEVVSGHWPREDPVWHEDTAAQQAAADASMKSMSWPHNDPELVKIAWKASLDEFKKIYGFDDVDKDRTSYIKPDEMDECR